jgi:uncharacterized membrane protein
MQARYGVTPAAGWKRALAVALGAVLLAGLGYGAWLVSNPAVSWEVTAYEVVSPHLATVTFQVNRRAGTTVVCVVRAQDQASTDVGYATVTIPAGAAQVTPTYPLATRAEAVIIEVLGCADNRAPKVPAPQFPPGTANPPQQPSVAGA